MLRRKVCDVNANVEPDLMLRFQANQDANP